MARLKTNGRPFSMHEVMTDQWTAEDVRKALAEAYRVLSASGGRVGHKRLKAAWPDHAVEWEDMLAQVEHKTMRKTMLPRLRPTSIQIHRMEIVLIGERERPAWLNGMVRSYPTGRKMLMAGAMGAAHRYSGRQICEAFRWVESTFRWQRDKAADMVAAELNEYGIERW